MLERAPAPREAGAGLQLAPNATRVLRRLGLLEAVEAVAARPPGVRVRRARDGADLAGFDYGAEAERRYGAPFLTLHRADLQAVLLGAATRHPAVTVETGAAVEGVAARGDGRLAITVRDGAGTRTLPVDGLVGADGLRSRVRALAMLEGDGGGRVDKLAWRALVPAAEAPDAARGARTVLWLGPGLHLVHYPVRGGSLVNVVAVADGRWTVDPAADLWSVAGDARAVRARFAPWCADARALVEAAVDWRVWPLLDRPPLPRWSRGAITLLGDAAHPMLPFLAQGASQAVADAGALGEAVAGAGDLAGAFAAYEAARRPRAARAQRESRRQGLIYRLRPPLSAGRDMVMRRLGRERMLARYDWLYHA